MKKILMFIMSIFLVGCVDLPEGVKPAQKFKLDRYLGTWYEIARLDHRFERGMNNVTAEYSLREDGGVTVKNRGYMVMHQEWRDAEGKAFFVGDPDVGHLKVSFFGPFYGSYAIFELGSDEDEFGNKWEDGYQYSFISGGNTDYLWLLARTPQIDENIIEAFETKAQSLGFDTSELIYVHHN